MYAQNENLKASGLRIGVLRFLMARRMANYFPFENSRLLSEAIGGSLSTGIRRAGIAFPFGINCDDLNTTKGGSQLI